MFDVPRPMVVLLALLSGCRGIGAPAASKATDGTRLSLFASAVPGQIDRLTAGASFPATAAILTTFHNLGARPVELLIFAIDDAGTVHWIAPGETSETPVTLPPQPRETPLPETVVLDELAAGPLRLLTVVALQAPAVSVLRKLPAAALTTSALAAAYPEAAIEELQLIVRSPLKPTPPLTPPETPRPVR